MSTADVVGFTGVFAGYAAVCLVGGVAVLLLLPETRGRPLYEIRTLLHASQRAACAPCGGGAADLDAHGTADEGLVGSLEAGLAASAGASGNACMLDQQHQQGSGSSGVVPLKRRQSSALVLAS